MSSRQSPLKIHPPFTNTYLVRLTIPETPRYTFDIEQDVQQAVDDVHAYKTGKWGDGEVDDVARAQAKKAAEGQLEIPKASWADFGSHYSEWRNLKVLLGCALSWFFLVSILLVPPAKSTLRPQLTPQPKDIAFYGLGLNNSIILSTIGFSGGSTVYEIYHKTAIGNLILVLAGAVPGYWVSACLIDTIGRKPVQIFGFFMLTVLFCVIGFDFWNLSGGALMALYTLAQFFFNAGPNSTTFVIPGECFPTRYRSTSHGISAASGKVGAIIAQLVFGPLKTIGADATKAKTDPRYSAPWIAHIMQIFALFMLCGLGTSFLVPETARKTLEELAGESAPKAVTDEKNAEEGRASPPDSP